LGEGRGKVHRQREAPLGEWGDRRGGCQLFYPWGSPSEGDENKLIQEGVKRREGRKLG